MATVDDRCTRDESVDDDDVRGDVVPRCQRRPADVRSRTCLSSSSTLLTAAKRYEQSVVVRADAPLRGPLRSAGSNFNRGVNEELVFQASARNKDSDFVLNNMQAPRTRPMTITVCLCASL